MQDCQIVELYWQRDENAITETQRKYGNYLFKIAENVLFDIEESEEIVNDTYLKAWNSMPQNRPKVLSSYLGKIARQSAIDVFRRKNRGKRKVSQYALSLEELKDCASVTGIVDEAVELQNLGRLINEYLKNLSPQNRVIFVLRYYYMDSISEIAKCCNMSQSKVKSILYRTRIGLKKHLEEEGYLI